MPEEELVTQVEETLPDQDSAVKLEALTETLEELKGEIENLKKSNHDLALKNEKLILKMEAEPEYTSADFCKAFLNR